MLNGAELKNSSLVCLPGIKRGPKSSSKKEKRKKKRVMHYK